MSSRAEQQQSRAAAEPSSSRAELEAAIERAITLLDALDGDPDCEDDDPDAEHDGAEPFAADLRGGAVI
ncbi:hypothetical protein [Sphingomonas baiyangensis]|uniref:Uncharacterized protein n=1 Tax=Sphingomonas baiyangensis TaxID=2572576 RepID=A0A4U1L163_9SPHN|nr:hypothetical protein [Sphingomonas baiyangensis]TKD50557.1 hypothetical protein FBR43_07110 [Sphingomonas baiyangensis]